MPKRHDRPLRVLYVTPFAEQVSGPDESLLLLLRRLGDRVRPLVALPPNSPFRVRYIDLGASLIEQPISRIQRFQSPVEVARYGLQLTRSTARLLNAVRKDDVDLVHANMEVSLEASLVARMLGVPCVFHYRGNTLDEPKRVFDTLTWVWTELGDHVFAISEGCADIFRSRGRGRRVEVLYNAIETAPFLHPSEEATRAVRTELGLDDATPTVLTVGRIHPRKDLETFVRAACHPLVPAKSVWLVAGSSHGAEGRAYEEAVRKLAAEAGVGSRMRFLGARQDVPALLAAADLFVMTSRHEGFGRAAAEAMLARRPSVLTREGAFPELLRDGTDGLLADPEDAGAFAHAIAALLANPARRRRMGEQARQRALALFDPDGQAERVVTVYRRLLGEAPSAGAPEASRRATP